jgi:hypothetical protein
VGGRTLDAVVYVVERYLPGLDQRRLVRLLAKLEHATEELRGEGTQIRYLGSTIVPGDEACFCQFEGPSEGAVAEANRRAGLPVNRIVAAVSVPAPAASEPRSRRGRSARDAGP